jgi:hypothetical protein
VYDVSYDGNMDPKALRAALEYHAKHLCNGSVALSNVREILVTSPVEAEGGPGYSATATCLTRPNYALKRTVRE